MGGPLSCDKLLRDRFRPLLRKAALPPIRFHDLRHTAATRLLEQGVHPKVVSEMLGHTSVAITLDIYSHVSPDMQRQAVSALDALFSRQLSPVAPASGAVPNGGRDDIAETDSARPDGNLDGNPDGLP